MSDLRRRHRAIEVLKTSKSVEVKASFKEYRDRKKAFDAVTMQKQMLDDAVDRLVLQSAEAYKSGEVLNVEKMMHASGHLGHLQAQIAHVSKIKDERRMKLDSARKQYLHAMFQQKVLEKKESQVQRSINLEQIRLQALDLNELHLQRIAGEF